MSLFKLPKETVNHIFGFANLKPKNIVSLQRTSKKFRNHLWGSVDRLDLNEWSVHVDPNILIDRLDSKIIRHLDLTGYNFIDSQGNELSTSDIIRRYPLLETLKLDEIPDWDFAELSVAIPAHKSLVEITIYGYQADEKHRAITDHIRLVMKSRRQPNFNKFLDVPTFNCETLDYLRINQCSSTCNIKFESKITSRGISANGVTFLGAEDGTIFVIAKRNGEMVIIQTVKEHSDSIRQLHYLEPTETIFAASEDGTVSKWHWSHSKLNLEHKFSFSEPMYFVAAWQPMPGFEKSRVAAASKHTLYFILNGKICEKTHHFEDEIIAMDSEAIYQVHAHQEDINCVSIATEKYYYEADDIGEVIQQTQAGLITPIKHFKNIYDVQSSKPAKAVQCSSHLSLKILAMQLTYTITAFGSVIQIEYEYTNQTILGRLSPRISRAEISAKKFPECQSMWYSQDYLYAIFSNNRLYRWSLGIEGRYKQRSEH